MTPPLVQLQLATKVIRVCAECAQEPPRHQYFCVAVRDYTRVQTLRERVDLDDRIRQFDAAIAAADADGTQAEADMCATYGMDGLSGTRRPTPLLKLHRDRRYCWHQFWEWAWWLGLDFWESTKEQRDDVRAEVSEMRTLLNRGSAAA